MRMQKYLMPKSYFFYSRLIDGIEEDISYVGALFRLSTPILIGCITEMVFHLLNLENAQLRFSAFAAFGTIFLLIWPDILNPELISPAYAKMKWKLYGLYLVLSISFPGLGFFGGKVTKLLIASQPGLLSWVDFPSIGNGIIGAVLFWIGSSLLIWFQVKLFK